VRDGSGRISPLLARSLFLAQTSVKFPNVIGVGLIDASISPDRHWAAGKKRKKASGFACLNWRERTKLLQRSFQQCPRKPFHLDSVEPRELLCGISVIMRHKKLPP
jgi:hypothetical protein